MPTGTSKYRGMPVPGATSGDNRLNDIIALKNALAKVDLELHALRRTSVESISFIDGGNAFSDGSIRTSGRSLAQVEALDALAPGDTLANDATFTFAIETYTPAASFAF